ncbi:porin family protein [Flavobacterium macacae]|uniref:PorT family protein n=1 Tax=Flavobacterium macacae TaxID=2488993 RepID=A0A3P3WCD6_9FLAO|nr:porin family protein [Flavobacterium macacae]RRJ92058.1 PorT family protein [Flavobacterium macacae]
MKFFNAIYLTIALSHTASYGQDEKVSDSSKVVITKLGIGVKAGFNFSTVSQGDLKKAPDARTSFYVGASYEFPIIEDLLSIQPEIIYSQQGFEKREMISEERFKSIYKVNYITVPVLARYYIVRGFSLDAGPQFSLRVQDDFRISENDAESSLLQQTNCFDFGLSGGLSFQFESGIFINGRYTRGFREIIEGSNAKNTVIQFGIGYKF